MGLWTSQVRVVLPVQGRNGCGSAAWSATPLSSPTETRPSCTWTEIWHWADAPPSTEGQHARSPSGSSLFQVVNTRYTNGSSTMVTTNVGIGSWATAFGDDPMVAAAMLDRLLHHGVVVRHRRTLLPAPLAPSPRRSTVHRNRGEPPCQLKTPTGAAVRSAGPGSPRTRRTTPPPALLLRRLPNRGLPTPSSTRTNPAAARRETRRPPRRQKRRNRTPREHPSPTPPRPKEKPHEPQLIPLP